MSRTEKKADVTATSAARNGKTAPANSTHEDIAMRAYEIYQQRGVIRDRIWTTGSKPSDN
jgi:hypothetical protein